MVQIARIQSPNRVESDNIAAVIDSVVDLHSHGRIVVGHTYTANGILLIEPWPETSDVLRTRLATAIDESRSVDRGFCFWVQLVEHFAS